MGFISGLIKEEKVINETTYTLTKIETVDLSEEFDHEPGVIEVTHRLDGFIVPVFIIVNHRLQEMSAVTKESGEYVQVQDKGLMKNARLVVEELYRDWRTAQNGK
ncbi:hypothetical protein [Bacillus mycoides]|uniref:hypothetical protein n=1 Tax=Bacillus mycoides TaxID=1405 RepID=UPI003A7FBD7B